MTDFGYQEHAIQFLKDVPKGILALSMRMGKSRCALMAAEGPVLIVCPVPVKINWTREIAKWRPEWSDIQILNTKRDVPRYADVTILPFSILAHHVNSGKLKKPEYLIIDEVHYAKELKNARTKATMKLIRSVKRCALLSGTPMPNRPMELYPMLKTLGVVKNKANFGMEYCAGWMSPWGWDYTGASNLDKLAELVKPVMFSRSAKDLGPGICPPVVVELDLPLEEREKEFNLESIAESPHSIAFEAVSDILHMSGLRKIPQAVEHIVNVLQSEQKVIVWAWHRDVVEELTTILGEQYGAAMIHGGTSKRQDVIDEFQARDDIRVLVCNIKAAGVGVEIVAASYNVVVETNWTPGDLDQALHRAWGPNQSNPVRTDILTVHRSIDSIVLRKILLKQENINRVIQETEIMTDKTLDQFIAEVIEQRATEKEMSIADYLVHIHLAEELEVEEYAETTEEEAPAEPEVEAFSLEDIRQKLAAVMREEGADRVRFILGKFGAAKLSDLDEDQYAEVIDLCNEGDA